MSAGEVEPQEEHDTLDGVPPPAATYELLGHEGAWETLMAARRSGRLHHAWLFQGPRGIGKATAAFAFARKLLSDGAGSGSMSGDADGPVFDPADPVSRQIAGGSHPNLLHITRPVAERGAGFKTQITVEEVRRLNRFFRTTTSGGQWRIAIIDPADDMNRNAANALLKILEEPPERSVFLITNHLPGRLLPTIRSRCRVLRFESLEESETAAVLRGLELALGEAELAAAAELSQGSARTAVALVTSGGLEAGAHLGRIFLSGEPDWQAIQSLADILTAKGRETGFELMLAAAFKRLGDEAEARLSAGDLDGASRIAALWTAESARMREGLAFNLDRKQLLLTFFQNLFALRRALAAS